MVQHVRLFFWGGSGPSWSVHPIGQWRQVLVPMMLTGLGRHRQDLCAARYAGGRAGGRAGRPRCDAAGAGVGRVAWP